MTATRSSSGSEGLDQCPVCRSRLVSLYEKQTGLFAVGCDNDDCHFTVEAYGTTQADAVRQWNTRGNAQLSNAQSIAAVIDPVAFDPISLNDTHPGWQYRREVAIETANKILALAPKPEPAAWANGDELDNMLDDRTATVAGQPDGFRRTPLYAAPMPASNAQRQPEPVAAALARRLCQMFDSGGESHRSARARHASAIFHILNRDAPEYAAEQARCDADPVGYLREAEDTAVPSTK